MYLNHLKNMILLTRTIIFLFLLGSLSVFASSTAWTLEDCINQAKKASLKLQSSKLNEESASISLRKAKNSRYPDLSASVNNSLYDSPFQSGAQDHYRLSLGISSSMNNSGKKIPPISIGTKPIFCRRGLESIWRV